MTKAAAHKAVIMALANDPATVCVRDRQAHMARIDGMYATPTTYEAYSSLRVANASSTVGGETAYTTHLAYDVTIDQWLGYLTAKLYELTASPHDRIETPVLGHRNTPKNPTDVLGDVLAELARATALYPTWPTDPLHALAILGEEYGELTKEVLQLTYEPHKTNAKHAREEAIQTAATALRFAASLDTYVYRAGDMHHQPPCAASLAAPFQPD